MARPRKTPVVRSTHVIAYLRVSTDVQKESGLGLAAQRARLEAECAHRGWSDVEWIEDAAYSAKSLDRPGIRHALELLSSNQAGVLVTAKVDRLSRSLLDFAALMDRAWREGWTIIALDLGVDTSTPAGEMMANVMASFAQYERRLISQRTSAAMAAKRAQGMRLGRPVRLPGEIRRFIVTARAEGFTLQSIADTLNERGIVTAQGGKCWMPGTISAVLRSAELDAAAV
jgi:DNA invertase Pin-like site-specific DNA recombinase